MMDRLYSVSDAGKLLGGVSVWTVRAWLSQGRLRRTKVGGRTMVTESELERFIRDGNGSQHDRPKSPSKR